MAFYLEPRACDKTKSTAIDPQLFSFLYWSGLVKGESRVATYPHKSYPEANRLFSTAGVRGTCRRHILVCQGFSESELDGLFDKTANTAVFDAMERAADRGCSNT